ncbi:eEF1A lysine and N-terminal methyltransferase-like [Actinia tenebrosa]|uniref:EEF1A lysine and N-terminal methyltransferase-like n=1 Tax=Actinia tenebrosa TaxID=6105 RepID=A0A6P8J889_ACTTE|nr:eEF1A lysine and N-terminal methyltransferase-like [Actinia tenebrosa]
MNLLPKTKEQFKSKEYWDQFFRNRKESFEWYGNYGELSTILHKYCKVKDATLVLGCGNSQLSEDLYDLGYRGLVNIDISDVVIRQMKERNKERRAEMEFIKMDMLDMDFNAETFNVILDKGTLDAIFVNTLSEVISDVNKMFEEIQRVLKTNGRYICITLVQEHILDKLLSHFINGWFIRVHKIEATESPLPVYAFIFTKTKFSGQKGDSIPKILEICLDGSDKIQRVSSTTDIKLAIEDLQKYAMVKQSLGKIKPGDIFSLELWCSSVTMDDKEHREPRYTLTVVDSPPSLSQNGLFAIFIVPQGRETDKSFASQEGQKELAATAKFQRLIIASLHRGHKYENIETIKKELSAKVMELAPDGVINEKMVPFLSDGGDIGSRDTLDQGTSEISGDYVIEEVERKGGERQRRLVLLSNADAIQSEARIKIEIKTVKGKKGKTKKKTEYLVDHSYLFDVHHQGIVAGLAFVEGITDNGSKKSGLLVGLGSGCLSMFIHEFYTQIVLHTVEKDPEIVKIAKKWFNCIEDDRLKIFTEDGLDFIKWASTQDPKPCYHVIILDVGIKSKAPDSVTPPISFLEPIFLASVKEILHKKGVLIIKFKCSSTDATRTNILQELQSLFQEVCILKLDESDCEIIFALPEKRDMGITQNSRVKQIKNSVAELQKYGERSKNWDEDTDLCFVMDNLKVL